MFITDSGVVAAAQIERGAGIDFDIAAVTLAKQLRFKPASLGNRPVGVWFLLPITTEAAPEPCFSMAVPISAGFASFADSQQLDRPELGMLYRYRGMPPSGLGNLTLDVFIYPQAGWPPLNDQVRDLVKSLDVMRDRGDFTSYEVIGWDKVGVKVRSKRLGHEVTIQGYSVRLKITGPSGEQLNSYFAVFPEESKYIKFRVTYAPDRRVQSVIDDFVREVLEARASQPAHCPPL
ncbi:MAG TPA: hypothetical protein VL243_12550 [Vicinamibacterales bacterium]|jgi:hypothetical protein|nr:hypothetical protein [Vicinamibacterales bacterium]